MKISEEVSRLCHAIQRKSMTFQSDLHPALLNDLIQVAIESPEKPVDYNFIVKEPHVELLDSICLTSGGADSTIAWYLEGKPKGLYINIGQPYLDKEMRCVLYHQIDYHMEFFGDLFQNTWKHIIPARNFLFLTAAAERIKNDGIIYFAVTEGEGLLSGKGDKSYQFISSFEDWYQHVTGKRVNIKTMGGKTKAGWLKEFQDRGFDRDLIRHHTVTCFSEGKQCGECQACLRKYLSFIAAFRLDTSEDYNIHPMIGCKEYVDKYRVNLQKALDNQDFSHYSELRCNEDLSAIAKVQTL